MRPTIGAMLAWGAEIMQPWERAHKFCEVAFGPFNVRIEPYVEIVAESGCRRWQPISFADKWPDHHGRHPPAFGPKQRPRQSQLSSTSALTRCSLASLPASADPGGNLTDVTNLNIEAGAEAGPAAARTALQIHYPRLKPPPRTPITPLWQGADLFPAPGAASTLSPSVAIPRTNRRRSCRVLCAT
jgi:hypothetical protein